MSGILQGKNIILGVCGGIAAYKIPELLRIIVKQGASVRVIMTRNAEAFIGKVTFEALSGNPVCVSLFSEESQGAIRHIAWAQECDAVVIAPATANMIGKLANGIADDALSTFMLAVTSPRIICPAMNTNMYENRATHRNMDILESDGFIILEPDAGELACGMTGAGRLPSPEYIADRLGKQLCKKDFVHQKILVSAGPTMEPIDPVRFISNHSSGKMGYAIAKAAEHRGADVTLVSGPTSLRAPVGVHMIHVKTADEMAAAMFDNMETSTVVIKVAAVADYKPNVQAEHKIKKKDEKLVLQLDRNVDILKELGKRKTNQILVGFAAETKDLDIHAREKLQEKNLDMIVGNIVGNSESGFGLDTNTVTFYFPDGKKKSFPTMGKNEVADILLDHIAERATLDAES
ncbi:MAG: bifunctional phosphopantothenoylcysteine decarboxylase/phosphopantothenate--cysteine ligase CoaBC [Deltaproteobacteria bacterium]|nr:MAG: bifunctional phosphopantothenoylcysteine decarboxylase/phosphopantothenate--cysteine ligase CoaBC [Deltaproteobacteria bacterium]